MDLGSRYQVIDKIADGEFATVYHARDLELSREVAIKQIHQQFLEDPSQLDRYWQEAQLLASLEHPYVLTIYDINRQRGMLILELMYGSIPQRQQGEPIDLDFLRVTLICALHALRVLEQNSIVHGDIKPGNLLIDRQNRVKIGDFGIARRIQGDDGSLVKGSTKYMAPEVVSDQFGPVGPHSDLYSLGFSAYELMCGSNFEQLFPGLDMFGGNRQMAWIMWHAAADRRLPEIRRVLEGVPDDLVAVIERLTEKDPARRYQSAEQALADLRVKAQLSTMGPTPEEEEATANEEAEQARKRKRLLIAAMFVSVLASVGMLFIPNGSTRPTPSNHVAQPSEGRIVGVDLKQNFFFLRSADGSQDMRIDVNVDQDRIVLNGQRVSLSEVQKGDEVRIDRFKSENGRSIKEIIVSRNVGQTIGTISEVDSANGAIMVASTDSNESPIRISVPSNIESMVINGSDIFNSKKFSFADLRKGDRVEVYLAPGDERSEKKALSLAVTREVSLDGYVVAADAQKRTLTVRLGKETTSPLKTYPLVDGCQISLNGETTVGGQPVTLAALRAGDHVATRHDKHFIKIDATRDVDTSGEVASVDNQARRLFVKIEGHSSPVEFTVAADAKIQVAGRAAPVKLDFIRPGDKVDIEHDSQDLDDPKALAIVVTPQTDKRLWAIVVGQENYDDARLSPLDHTADSAKLLADRLADEYRVAQDQQLVAIDSTRLKLQQDISDLLGKIPADAQLVVYFAGHGYLDEDKSAYLATKEFDVERMSASGLSLRWLIDEMEKCKAREKLLLLDACHPGKGEYTASQPSTAELADSLRPSPNRPISTSVAVLASCSKGERGAILTEERQSLFSSLAAKAFSGKADTNEDRQVDGSELFLHLQTGMSEFGAAGGAQQTPVLFLPDATPARLTPEAQQQVRELLALLNASQVDTDQLNGSIERAEGLAPGQPDFKVAGGLVALKHGKTSISKRYFEDASEHPVARQSLTWQALLGRQYDEGLGDLVKLIDGLPKPKGDRPYEAYPKYIFHWAGTLRGFIDKVLPDDERPDRAISEKLNQAVLAHGEMAKALYVDGYAAVRRMQEKINQQIRTTNSEAKIKQLRFRAGQLTTYSKYDFDVAEAFLISELDK